ncbi:DEAD/DEAH box helicase [Promethearchaeum syntrophicum]|uniref:DEAD/DEAH box helicase n=1 Tax=Promethearchaeum syntrophicum TaxID=2594042 RepID=A0A5B9DCJ7_9ARCH|nr:DEAD/DEAH box helicase [Candidatus Prometheoarchaeum syntrophicum]QEE16884.1 putative ATP-dependent RNA helicase [Candidatus Prometheoarchaeum syntrophicum]
MLFTEMDINPQIIQALEENQIMSPTEIQEKSIPHGLSMQKSHVIGQAKTGSGKTLAFAIPIIEKINPNNRNIQALVIVPTRELCKQNAVVFRSITKYKKIKIVEVYGGASIRSQIEQIQSGGQVIIATPGRLNDLIRRRIIKFKSVNFVALDEADRMLDMGFLPDIEFVLLDAMRNISPRLFLFSATLFDEIKKVIYKFTKKDVIHEIDVSKDSLTVDNCDQYAYYVKNNKFWNFIKILNDERPAFSLIFTKTKRNAEKLCNRLNKANELNFNLKVGFINGDLSQAKREKTVSMFRNKQLSCLVATNVLARGLDFPKVTHVFNYDMPRDPEDYVHRIGRTARVGGVERNVASGKAISIVSDDQRVLMKKIEKLLNNNIEKRTIPNLSNMEFVPEKYDTTLKKNVKQKQKSNQGNKRQFDRKKKNHKNIKKNSSKPEVIIKIVPEKLSTKSNSSQKLKTRSHYTSSKTSNNQFDKKRRNPKFNNKKKKKKQFYSKNRQKISSSAK